MTAFIVLAACMAIIAASAVAWPLLRAGSNRHVPLIAAASILALSGLLYAAWSNWDWSGQKQIPAEGAEVAAMVGRLENRLNANPNDVSGWLMLGRSYLAMERFEDAAAAYDKAMKLSGETNVEAALGMGEAISMRANGQITPPAAQLFETALRLAPQNPKALLFGGFSAAGRGDKALARSRWEMLKSMNPPPALVQMLDARIAALGTSGEASAEAPAAASPASPAAPGAAANSEAAVNVRISPQLSSKVTPDALLFVFAREPGVAGPPLAVKRLTAADIGTTVKLSAADSMMPSRTLHSGQSVTITARVSFSGQPTPAPGDLYGELTYGVGRDGVRDLIIDRVAQ
jgi:cytochrome c-type biogenesis protein CcmH